MCHLKQIAVCALPVVIASMLNLPANAQAQSTALNVEVKADTAADSGSADSTMQKGPEDAYGPPWGTAAMSGEIGLFWGGFRPSSKHELYDADRSTVTWQKLEKFSPELGLRAGFYPLRVLGVEVEPGISTVNRPLRERGGKVYIDFGQNGHGQTIVAPYAVRPLPGAPASCPLEWREVTARLDPARFNLKTMAARFETMADPLTPVLGPGIDMAAAIARIEARMGSVGSPLTRGSAARSAGGRTRGRSRPPRA